MDDDEVLDLDTIRNADVMTKLKEKASEGYKISLVVKKNFNFSNQQSVIIDNDPFSTTKNDTAILNGHLLSKFGPFVSHPNPLSQPTLPFEEEYDMPEVLATAIEEPDKTKSPRHNHRTAKNQRGMDKKQKFQKQHQSLREISFKLEEVVALLKQADHFFENEDWMTAKGLYSNIIKRIRKATSENIRISVQKSFIAHGIKARCQQGFCFQKLRDYKKALHSFRKCLKIYYINEPDTYTKILLEIANSQFELKQFNNALSTFLKALRIFETLNWQVSIGEVLLKLALIYSIYELYDDAKKMVFHARGIFQSKLDPKDERMADIQFTLGQIFFFKKQYDFALEHQMKALELCKQIQVHRFKILKVLNAIAISNQAMGWPTKAVRIYEEAMNYIGEKDSILKAQIQNNIGVAQIDCQDLGNGQLSLLSALKIYQTYHPPIHPSHMRTTTNIKFVEKQDTQENHSAKPKLKLNAHRSSRSI